MPIGTSDGEYYDDSLAHSIGIAEGGQQERLYVSPGRAPGSSEKPADALKPEEGTGTPGKGSQQELPDVTNERRHDFLERMFIDAGNAIGSIGRGETPMWALDQTTGEFHTSPEGIEAAGKLTPFVMTGAMSPIIHLRGEGSEALNAGHDAFQEFLAGRGTSNIQDLTYDEAVQRSHSLEQQPYHYPAEGPGHPMDPREAAEHYVELHRQGDQQAAIDFTRNYEDQSTTAQFDRYVDHLDYLDRSGQSRGFRQTIEHNPNERGFNIEERQNFNKQIEEAQKGDSVKLIEDKNFSKSSGNRQFQYASNKGTGSLSITERMGGRDLWVNWIGLERHGSGDFVSNAYQEGPQNFGTKEIKSLLDQVKEAFPNAERIGGFRISGARSKTGSGSANAWLRIRKPEPGETYHDNFEENRAQEPGMQAVERALRE